MVPTIATTRTNLHNPIAVQRIKAMSTALLIGMLCLLSVQAVEVKNTNVFDMELEPCSTSGMAMSGITGTGHCVHVDESLEGEETKTICVDIPSFSAAFQKQQLKETEDQEKAERKGFFSGFFSSSASTTANNKGESLMLDSCFHDDNAQH